MLQKCTSRHASQGAHLRAVRRGETSGAPEHHAACIQRTGSISPRSNCEPWMSAPSLCTPVNFAYMCMLQTSIREHYNTARGLSFSLLQAMSLAEGLTQPANSNPNTYQASKSRVSLARADSQTLTPLSGRTCCRLDNPNPFSKPWPHAA